MIIRDVEQADSREWYRLRAMLWPECDDAQHTEQMEGYYQAADAPGYRVLVADTGRDRKLAGFVEIGIFEDENGGKQKVGWIMGIFADPAYAVSETTMALIESAGEWVRAQSCTELRAKCPATETALAGAYQRSAFRVRETTIEFVKTL